MSPDMAPSGIMSMISIRNRKPGEDLKCTISDERLPIILNWNKPGPPARFDAAIAAEGLFKSEPAPWMLRIIWCNPKTSRGFLLTTMIPQARAGRLAFEVR